MNDRSQKYDSMAQIHAPAAAAMAMSELYEKKIKKLQKELRVAYKILREMVADALPSNPDIVLTDYIVAGERIIRARAFLARRQS